MPKIKNIIIFAAIAIVLVLVYVFFIKKSPSDTTPLVSSTSGSGATATVAGDTSGNVTEEFLSLLLSVKNIKLDDTIFSDKAFNNLDGSHSITLTPDGTEGRVNPFAQFGADVIASTPGTTTTTTTTTNTQTNTGTQSGTKNTGTKKP